jgi:hypothetical protein
VTQRNIEIVIGRLLTDEAFRESFQDDPERALRALVERGTHLTEAEIAALVSIDSELWPLVADRIDPRLQKARLTSESIDL